MSLGFHGFKANPGDKEDFGEEHVGVENRHLSSEVLFLDLTAPGGLLCQVKEGPTSQKRGD